jgi:glycerol-3-phosphate dehydrogenase
VAQSVIYDLLVIGGGINGAGIARDAAGRGLKVALCEQSDLASATSSASSKLIHGGLRYLEQYEFRLVAEALAERETLLGMAPHLITPLTFVLPWVPGMRPRWMLRLGLWLYDHLARRSVLPPARPVMFGESAYGAGLRSGISHGFCYSDCWVDDARLVLANCVSAARHGAWITTRTRVTAARAEGGHWVIALHGPSGRTEVRARVLVNAAGPWVRSVLTEALGQEPRHNVRLVKGSHIVIPRLYAGDHAFILQNDDGRVVLVIPYRDEYSLIGTTDIPHSGRPEQAIISSEEINYLCEAVNRYFRGTITSADVLWSFSGVRPLYDDGSENPSEITRDYRLLFDADGGAPLLSIYGGKITTYRRLAEHSMRKLAGVFRNLPPDWTATEPLPGGGPGSARGVCTEKLEGAYPGLPRKLLHALAARHGTEAAAILGARRDVGELGVHFGDELYAFEVEHFMDNEWASTADDILWRRTKAGLGLDDMAQQALARYMLHRQATADVCRS